jgi:hypothetical protein
MNKILLFILCSFLTLFTSNASGQESKFEAIFIYNFTKYLNWPASSIGNEFVIAVLGNNAIIDDLKQIAQSKSVLNKKVSIKKVSPSEINQSFQILFIPRESSNLIKIVSESLTNSAVLIVTEKNGGCLEGACINFLIKNNNLSFEMSKSNISKKEISINSTLVSLAEVVY